MLYQVIEDGEIIYSHGLVEHDDTYHLVTGGFRGEVRYSSASTTLTENDYTLICSALGGNRVVSLPPAGAAVHRIYNIQKFDSSANTVTIDGDGGELVGGSATQVLTGQYDTITIHSDGNQWFVIGRI